ncbi:hypothetical protein SAMN02910456_01922 [Ruminococcaceae bacterium YRB3002]|nr:hypothetical protein SAMN02910456_01922 [Ruminococcaceae bacterium YRB3002]
MKKLSKKVVNTGKGFAIITVSVLGIITMTACSINYSKLAEGIGDLGRSIDHAVNGTVPATSGTDLTTPTVETEETDPTESSEEVTPTPTPAPTATPIPTPTPMPERVDFSELITDTISEGVDIQLEDFAESFHLDGEETELATFKGNRMVIDIPDNKNVQTAVNLVLDGVYSEAAGLYARYSNEAASEYSLDPELYMASPYRVKINYSYSFNGRLISVVTDYEVARGNDETPDEVVAHKDEVFTFDVLTGQYVTLAMVSKDAAAFEDALKGVLAQGISTEDETYDKKDVTDPVIVVHQQGAGAVLGQVYGIVDGSLCHAPVDLTNMADYLNSYGKIVYKIS